MQFLLENIFSVLNGSEETEGEVRKRIKVLLSGSSFNLELITAFISGKASSLAAYINQILPIFYNAALSPVITEKAKLLFDFRMSESSHEVSPSKMIAGGVTSQVIKPAYHLPFHWKSAQPRTTPITWRRVKRTPPALLQFQHSVMMSELQ